MKKEIDEKDLFIKIQKNNLTDKFLSNNLLKYKNIMENGGFIYLTDPEYFYLIFPGPRPEWYRFRGESEVDITSDKVKLKWRYLDKRITFQSIKTSAFPDHYFTTNTLILNKNNLKTIKILEYPAYNVDIYKRKVFSNIQTLEINFIGKAWNIKKEYKNLNIISEYGEKFKAIEINDNKAIYKLNSCLFPKFGCNNDFYHTRTVKVTYTKAGYKPINKTFDMNVGKSLTKQSLMLKPFQEKVCHISLENSRKRAISENVYIKLKDNTEWEKINQFPVKKEFYRDLYMVIHANGYKPQDIILKESGNKSILLGKPNLPLWIIIEASAKINANVKDIAKNLVKYLLKMAKDGRLNKDKVWFSFFMNKSLNLPKQLKFSNENSMSKKLKKVYGNGPVENINLLNSIKLYPKKLKNDFTKNGFNLLIISTFQPEFLTEKDFKNKYRNISFLKWINKSEIILSLSQIYLLEFDISRQEEKDKSTCEYLIKLLNLPPWIHYQRLYKPTDLKNIDIFFN